MPGHRPFSELTKDWGAERVGPLRMEAHRELLLSELRKLAGLTRRGATDRSGLEQAEYHRREPGDDMRLSTLRRIVEELGGELEVVAHLPDGRVSVRPSNARAPRSPERESA